MTGAVTARETNKLRARVASLREPFAIKVRQEEQAIRPRWRRTRQLNDPVVRILIFVKRPARPPHRIAPGVQDGKRAPPASHPLDIGDYRIENRFLSHQRNQRRSTRYIRSH